MMDIVIDGKTLNQAPGMQIRNQQNLIRHADDRAGQRCRVRYQLDGSGAVFRVWLLTRRKSPPVNFQEIPQCQKLFIRTFGCQMNEYDSDKMADVLNASEEVVKTDNPEEADIILFNTCSVREKAQEKVFHDLGRVRHLKQLNPNLVIGVGGCVASQEGAAIVARAPYVDVVFGPQTLHRLLQLIAERREGARRPWISFLRSRSSMRCPGQGRGRLCLRLDHGGCSKFCTFCIVPYTRGEEVSRPFDDVLTEVAGLASQGVRRSDAGSERIQRLPGPDDRTQAAGWRLTRTDRSAAGLRCCSSMSPRSPASSASATPSQEFSARPDQGTARSRSWHPCTCRCSPARPRAGGDEAWHHNQYSRIQIERLRVQHADISHRLDRLHRRFPGETEEDFRRRWKADRRRRLRQRRSFIYSPALARRRPRPMTTPAELEDAAA